MNPDQIADQIHETWQSLGHSLGIYVLAVFVLVVALIVRRLL